MSGQHGVAHVLGLEDVRQVVRQRLDRERRSAPRADAVAALVVEHDTVALFAQPARHGYPDLVRAAPAVGEHDDRRIGTVALEVPHCEVRAILGPDDSVVGPREVLAPAECVPPVVHRRVARRRVGRAVGGQPSVGRPGRSAGCEGTTDHQEPPGAGAGPS